MKESVSISAARVVLVSLKRILQSISRSWKRKVLLLRKSQEQDSKTSPTLEMTQEIARAGVVAAAAVIAVHNGVSHSFIEWIMKKSLLNNGDGTSNSIFLPAFAC